MLLTCLGLLVLDWVERSEKAALVGSQKTVMGAQNRSLSRREDFEMEGARGCWYHTFSSREKVGNIGDEAQTVLFGATDSK